MKENDLDEAGLIEWALEHGWAYCFSREQFWAPDGARYKMSGASISAAAQGRILTEMAAEGAFSSKLRRNRRGSNSETHDWLVREFFGLKSRSR